MFEALRPVLNRGGAGRYISRAESIERLLPVAVRHLDLLYAYTGILPAIADAAARARAEAIMPYLRTEVSKIYETILSFGGTAPTGVARDPEGSAPAGRTDADHLDALLAAERDFGAALTEEAEAVHHQERTRAILNHNAGGSAQRLDVLRGIVAGLGR